MAIQGRFEADFSSFSTAVQAAEVQLRSFESGSNKVESALGRMTDGFSGRKVIQEATLMAAAVERVGGTSNLTESELSRVVARATEASAKLTAMGLDVPPGLKKIADEAHHDGDELVRMRDNAMEVAAAFGAAFSAERLVEFVQGSFEAAKSLQILSLQTQVGVEDLQVLGAATREYGMDANQLGQAIFQLSRRIAGGDQSAATGLHTMGLSLDEVRKQNGMELFLTIERGLATLQGSLRDSTAAELFGARVGRAMGAFATSADEAIDKNRKLNTVMSTESVKAAFEYANELERVQHNLSAKTVTFFGPLAEEFNTFMGVIDRGVPRLEFYSAVLQNIVTHSATPLATLIDQLNRNEEARAGSAIRATTAHAGALTAEAQAARFMASLEVDAAKELDAWQVKDLEHLKEIGALNAQNADRIGVNSAQFEKFQAGQAAQAAAIKAAADAAKELKKAEDTLFGEDAITKANLYAHALGGVENASKLTITATDKFHTTMMEALDAMNALGLGATKTADAYRALAQATTRLDKLPGDVIPLKDITAIPAPLPSLTSPEVLGAFDAETQRLNAEIAKMFASTIPKSIKNPAVPDAAKETAESIGGPFFAVFNKMASSADAAMAHVMSVLGASIQTDAYAKAGFSVSEGFGTASTLQQRALSNIGLTRPGNIGLGDAGSAIPGLGGGRGVSMSITVNANNSFYDTPDGRNRLGQVVGDAVAQRLRQAGVRM